ncbi:hypothetical protein TVAG_273190 [Trichomonas vaginalis G3]|uniref:Uncharacterized protein n=1 Tax=Trichomonas vaginalis (strain ATCC PRA-98 / G3) TaxID=412133 RepID=A2EZU5_TRIV3|nr:hypothetical protein TVAGG3_0197380 [Trichomonas vaginalis G3]EAY01808.1 hypothetical protein TVAG_273190 [Trichomonas vaginalis G3]KAI5550391.1 hypothetical protein TVAGG3_0197380 [Trichomonas vaginalis G3]|eukprot:XP_001314355.1 hypothetical protein [Trichomonas vaginalis G3]
MIALGDPSKSVTYHRLSQLANENPEMIDDPLLRYSFYNYPISVKRYNEEKGSTSSSSSSSSHSFFNWSYSKLRFHINENVIYRDEKSDNSPMAMFVQKYTDIKTYSLIISILLMLVWFLCFCYESYQSKCRFLVHFDHVKDSIHHMIKSIYLFSSYKMINNLNLTFKDCQKNVNFVYDFINGYNIQTNEDYYYVVNVLGYTSDMLSDYNCTFFANLDQKAKAKEIKKFYEAAFTEIKILLKDSPMSTFKKYFKLLSVFSTLYAFLSIFYLYLNVSYTFMWLPKKAIDFLSSRERLALLLLKKSLESWDLFKIYFPNENLKNEAEVIKKIDKPVVKQKSHHLNLTDSKLFVSFIGNYEQIDSSTFALMKPSYEEEIEKHTDNYLNEIDTMKGRRCSDSLDFERTDLNLNRRKSLNNIFTFNSKVDLVAKTIEETELNSLKVYYRFLIIYYAPWLAMLFIFFISRLTIFFVIDQTETYFNHILELLGQLTSQFKTPSNPSFYIRELEDLLSSDDLVSVNTLALNSTIIVGLILLIIALYMIYFLEYSVKLGYDSLFHFPVSYLEDLMKEKDQKPELKYSDKVIEIVCDKESKIITNITMNCEDLLFTNPLDIIGKKYDNLFTKDDENNIRIFRLNQKKKKKFLESEYDLKFTKKIALFDTENVVLKKNFIQNMSKFFQLNIAKEICEHGIFKYQIKNSYLAFIRFDSSESNISTEYLFKCVHDMIQFYSTVNLIRINGSHIIFLCRGNDLLIPSFLARDLISCMKKNKKLSGLIISSVLIEKIDFRGEISSEYELHIKIDNHKFERLMKSSFCVEDNHVFLTDKCICLNNCDENQINNYILNTGVSGKIICFDDIDNILSSIY